MHPHFPLVGGEFVGKESTPRSAQTKTQSFSREKCFKVPFLESSLPSPCGRKACERSPPHLPSLFPYLLRLTKSSHLEVSILLGSFTSSSQAAPSSRVLPPIFPDPKGASPRLLSTLSLRTILDPPSTRNSLRRKNLAKPPPLFFPRTILSLMVHSIPPFPGECERSGSFFFFPPDSKRGTRFVIARMIVPISSIPPCEEGRNFSPKNLRIEHPLSFYYDVVFVSVSISSFF